jgi:hypothetical protein
MEDFSIQKNKFDDKKRMRLSTWLLKAFGSIDNLVVIYFNDHLEVVTKDQYSQYKKTLEERIGDTHIARLFLAGKCEKYKADKQGRFQLAEERKEIFKEDFVYILKVDNDTYESVEVYPQSVYEKIVDIGTFAEQNKEPNLGRG